MPRVKRGVTAHRRHKKILKQAKGYYGARSRVFHHRCVAKKQGLWRLSKTKVFRRFFARLRNTYMFYMQTVSGVPPPIPSRGDG